MNGNWLPAGVLAAALLFGLLDIGFHYPRLPAEVASHFDAHGRPNGWSTKGQFSGLAVGTLIFVLCTLAPIVLVAGYAPPSLINLPHKNYWLAPERQHETRRAIARWGLWFTAATLWLMVFVFHEAMRANFRDPPHTVSMWWLLGSYLTVVTVLVAQLLIRFWRIP